MAPEHDLTPEHQPGQSETTVSNRLMELVVAGLFMVVAIVVMADSLRIGIGWAFDGPRPGYFPFYIGLIMFVASAVTFITHVVSPTNTDRKNFVDRSALWLVLKMLIPTIAFVALIGFLGLYVAAALYIIFFMWWLGKYSLVKAVPVGIAIPLVLFLVFEIAFLIPLPKGPLENALGF